MKRTSDLKIKLTPELKEMVVDLANGESFANFFEKLVSSYINNIRDKLIKEAIEYDKNMAEFSTHESVVNSMADVKQQINNQLKVYNDMFSKINRL